MTIHGTNLEAITDTLQLQLLEEGNNKLVVFSPNTGEYTGIQNIEATNTNA